MATLEEEEGSRRKEGGRGGKEEEEGRRKRKEGGRGGGEKVRRCQRVQPPQTTSCQFAVALRSHILMVQSWLPLTAKEPLSL